MTDTRLEPKANGIGVRLGTRRDLRLTQKALVDVQCLFHTYEYAIQVWLVAVIVVQTWRPASAEGKYY